MSKVRCKFYCSSVVDIGSEPSGKEVHLLPVTSGSEENEKFFNYTPYGELSIGTINLEAAAMFEVGKEYYIDIEPA